MISLGGLWEFFGLPDPDPKREPVATTSNDSQSSDVLSNGSGDSDAPIDTVEGSSKKNIPENWIGPRLPNGEAFHDLESLNFRKNQIPTRALRMVTPNEKHRIDLEGIAQRSIQGDISIVNLGELTHMQSQQNFLRRELRMLSENTGLHIYSLDKDEKLMLVPGIDVVVDITRHELGMNGLL
ncbi:MAG: hypothetical protein CMB73_06670 [Euryarchaeota archaeon]|nr:hypothetical protein [Euryarchaeota archaeon]